MVQIVFDRAENIVGEGENAGYIIDFLVKKKYLAPFFQSMAYWRGHQTSPTVASLKGRLPQKWQSKSTLSCEIVQIHSLFRHGFIKNPKSKLNRKRK